MLGDTALATGRQTPTYLPKNPWITMPPMPQYAPAPQPVVWMPTTPRTTFQPPMQPAQLPALEDRANSPGLIPRHDFLLPTKPLKRSETDASRARPVLRQKAVLRPRRNSRVRTPGPTLPPSDASVVSGEWVFVPSKRSRSVDATSQASTANRMPPSRHRTPHTPAALSGGMPNPSYTGDVGSAHMFPPTLRGGYQQSGESVTFY
jgi:hypothetical protein